MTQQKRAWLYCRIDAPEDEHGCLKEQKKELMGYAEQMGFEIAGTSQDTGSGLNFQRNGLTEVEEAAYEGRMDVLLVASISRIGRNTSKTMSFISMMDKAGIKIYSPAEGEITELMKENNALNIVMGQGGGAYVPGTAAK